MSVDAYQYAVLMLMLVLAHVAATIASGEAFKPGVSNRLTRIQQRYAEYGGVIIIAAGIVFAVLMLAN